MTFLVPDFSEEGGPFSHPAIGCRQQGAAGLEQWFSNFPCTWNHPEGFLFIFLIQFNYFSTLTFLLPAVGRHCSPLVSGAAATAATSAARTRLSRAPQPGSRSTGESVSLSPTLRASPLSLYYSPLLTPGRAL